MKRIFNFSNEDLARADWCEKPIGKLFAGGMAMIHGLDYSHPDPKLSLEGRIVFLSCVDEDGFWDCYDKNGDLLIIMDDNLLPISDKDHQDGSNQVLLFQYQTRYGS